MVGEHPVPLPYARPSTAAANGLLGCAEYVISGSTVTLALFDVTVLSGVEAFAVSVTDTFRFVGVVPVAAVTPVAEFAHTSLLAPGVHVTNPDGKLFATNEYPPSPLPAVTV